MDEDDFGSEEKETLSCSDYSVSLFFLSFFAVCSMYGAYCTLFLEGGADQRLRL